MVPFGLTNALVDLSTAKHFLAKLSPDLVWLLRQIESEDGFFRFPAQVTRAIANLKIQAYPRLYENEAAIGLIFVQGFLSDAETKELIEDLDGSTARRRGEFLVSLEANFEEQFAAVEIPKTAAEEKRALQQFEALSEEERAEATKFAQHFWMSFLASFHQMLSVMVHGEKLTALVARAKDGDDNALAKAVQIDKRILTAVPRVRERFERASAEGERDFLEALSYRIQCPPYRGKIRHKALWFAFAYLDMCGLLETLKHRELLDVLDEVGLGGYPNRIEDVKHLSKRLADYRAFKGAGMSTP
jgi:hypothetical protein